MKVLGIDPGSRCCGFGVVEDAGGTRVRHLAHGVLEVGAADAIEERLRALHEGLSRELLRHRPQFVALEDVFHAKNARSALVLGQARGVAILAAAQAGIPVRSFAPSVIKQAVTGTGRAEKQQVGRMPWRPPSAACCVRGIRKLPLPTRAATGARPSRGGSRSDRAPLRYRPGKA